MLADHKPALHVLLGIGKEDNEGQSELTELATKFRKALEAKDDERLGNALHAIIEHCRGLEDESGSEGEEEE